MRRFEQIVALAANDAVRGQTDNLSAARVGLTQCVCERNRGSSFRVAPSRYDNDVGSDHRI